MQIVGACLLAASIRSLGALPGHPGAPNAPGMGAALCWGGRELTVLRWVLMIYSVLADLEMNYNKERYF